MSDLNTCFEQFLRERVYLHNITPKTRDYYLTAWKAFVRSQATAPAKTPTAPVLTRSDADHSPFIGAGFWRAVVGGTIPFNLR